MCGISVEEAAAIGSELLDRLLARDRPQRDRLLRAIKRGDTNRACNVCGMPSATKAKPITIEIGSSTWSVVLTRSSQKLPKVAAPFRAKARVKATARAMPVAAERKF